MKFDTEINGELEGDHETPELIIESIEFWHCRLDKLISIPQGRFERFYERFKGIIDQDAIKQSEENKEIC